METCNDRTQARSSHPQARLGRRRHRGSHTPSRRLRFPGDGADRTAGHGHASVHPSGGQAATSRGRGGDRDSCTYTVGGGSGNGTSASDCAETGNGGGVGHATRAINANPPDNSVCAQGKPLYDWP